MAKPAPGDVGAALPFVAARVGEGLPAASRTRFSSTAAPKASFACRAHRQKSVLQAALLHTALLTVAPGTFMESRALARLGLVGTAGRALTEAASSGWAWSRACGWARRSATVSHHPLPLPPQAYVR